MASLAELMCVEIDSFDMGIYLTALNDGHFNVGDKIKLTQ